MNFIEKRLKNQNKFWLKEKSIFFLQICVITRDPCISKDRDGGMAALMTVCVMMPTLADTLAMTCKDSRIYKIWFSYSGCEWYFYLYIDVISAASDSPVSPPLAVWRSTQPILAVENPTVWTPPQLQAWPRPLPSQVKAIYHLLNDEVCKEWL